MPTASRRPQRSSPKRPNRAKARKKKSPGQRLLFVLYILLFTISLIIVVAYAAFRLLIKPPDVDSQVTFTPPPVVSGQVDVSQSPSDVTEPPTPSQLVLTRQEGVYTCLLMGSDDGNGKADTIMLGVFDTKNNTASLISIPRDTLVSISGKDFKVNAAYGLGGEELVRDTVSTTLGIPIDYYVSVDLRAFEAIVDEIGGVWFDVPMDMDYEDPFQDLYIHIPAGYQKLNGKQAVGVMRFRHGYASQDIGRTQTQRAFLTALIKQTVSLSNVTKVTSLANILNTYVTTDMPLDKMIWFATQAIDMDLDTALTSTILPNDWISPYIELRDQEVLDLINGLGIYQEEAPMEILHIRHK